MEIGQIVAWKNESDAIICGEVIGEEQDGHVLVALDTEPGDMRPVVFCSVAWLEAQDAEAPAEKSVDADMAPKPCPEPEPDAEPGK